MFTPVIPANARVPFLEEGEITAFMGEFGRSLAGAPMLKELGIKDLGIGYINVKAFPGWAYELYIRPRPELAPQYYASISLTGPEDNSPFYKISHPPVYAEYAAPAGAIAIRVQLNPQYIFGAAKLRTADRYELTCNYTLFFRVRVPFFAVQQAMQGINLHDVLKRMVDDRLFAFTSRSYWREVNAATLIGAFQQHVQFEQNFVTTLARFGLELVGAQVNDVVDGSDLKTLRDEEHGATAKAQERINNAIIDVLVGRIKEDGKDGLPIEDMIRKAQAALNGILDSNRDMQQKLDLPILPVPNEPTHQLPSGQQIATIDSVSPGGQNIEGNDQ